MRSAALCSGNERPQALLVLADRLLLHHRKHIMRFAAEQRLPGVYAYRELVEEGGLMSFGPSYGGMHKRAAYFVDKILRGQSERAADRAADGLRAGDQYEKRESPRREDP